MPLVQIHKDYEYTVDSVKRKVGKANITDTETLKAAFDSVAAAIRAKHL